VTTTRLCEHLRQWRRRQASTTAKLYSLNNDDDDPGHQAVPRNVRKR
jgi:hypothetical protein